MKKHQALFLDRDGTLVHAGHYPSRPEHLHLYEGIGPALRVLQQAGLRLVMITNQAGIARGYFTEADLQVMMVPCVGSSALCVLNNSNELERSTLRRAMRAVCFEKTANFIQDSSLHLANLCDANIPVLLSTKNAEDPNSWYHYTALPCQAVALHYAQQ
jgi:hypothetical protein